MQQKGTRTVNEFTQFGKEPGECLVVLPLLATELPFRQLLQEVFVNVVAPFDIVGKSSEMVSVKVVHGLGAPNGAAAVFNLLAAVDNSDRIRVEQG